MEKSRLIKFCLAILMLVLPLLSSAQTMPECVVENGKMVIRVPENFTQGALDSMLTDFHLEQKEFHLSLQTKDWSYFEKLGWKVKESKRKGITLVKDFETNDNNFWLWSFRPKTKVELQPGVPVMLEPFGVNRFDKRPGVWGKDEPGPN